MSIELVLWSILGLIGLVGGVLGIAASIAMARSGYRD